MDVNVYLRNRVLIEIYPNVIREYLHLKNATADNSIITKN